MSQSPGKDEGNEEPKKISFRFCREWHVYSCFQRASNRRTNSRYSSNLLYPTEDKVNNQLEFACRSCTFSEAANTSCIFRNELVNTVGETVGITQDVANDPTVSSVPDFCTLCGNEIFCEICGKESDRGFWLEVDDEDMMDVSGLETPPLTIPSSTASQEDFFDQQSTIATSFHQELPSPNDQPTQIEKLKKKEQTADTSQKEEDMPA